MSSSPQSEQEAVPLETIGNRLKRERLSKHQSLEDIAASTRISISALQALEESEDAKLPGRVFVQGFIRIYANHLGLDPEESIAHYIKDLDGTSGGKDKINVKKVLTTESMAETPRFLSSRQILLVVLAILLGFLLYIGRQTYYPATEVTHVTDGSKNMEQEHQETAPEMVPTVPESIGPTSPVTEEPSPTVESTTTEATQEATQPAMPSAPPEHAAPKEEAAKTTETAPHVAKETQEELQENILKANFIERTWMWIKIDDNPPQEYLFQPGEHFTWKAYKNIDINIGNAGGVILTLNGKPVPKTGKSGQVVRLDIPKISKITNKKPNGP